MVFFEKVMLCYISRPNGLQNKNSYCRHNFRSTRPVARFSGLGRKYIFMGKDFNFYHMFETNFSEQNEIWGAQKKFGGN